MYMSVKKSSVCALCVMASLYAKSDLQQTTGYGSGDNLEQAIFAAKVDAILNAGGRITADSEAKEDLLIKDEVTSQNDACLISYEVIEKGESFVGTYVRIKAKVSKDEDYILKDGKTDVRGVGTAENDRDAVAMAMCNAVLESGARISTVVKYENDELVADDAKVEARGVVVSCFVESSDKNKSKAVCRIFPDANSVAGLLPVRVSGVGAGRNRAVAEANARRDMVLGWGSEFFVHSTYKDGVQKSFSAERKCDAYISAEIAQNSEELGNGRVRMDGTRFQNASGLALIGRRSSTGIACGVNAVAAHKAALCDAFVNLGSHVVITVDYGNGRKVGEKAIYRSSYNYFGETSSAPKSVGGEYLVMTKIRAGGDLPAVDAGIAQSVETVGYGRGKEEAIMDAKQRAVDMVFGSPVKVSVTERDGKVADIVYAATHSEKGYVAKCEILSEEKCGDSTIVKIKAVVKNHDGDSILRWIWEGICTIFKFIWWVICKIFAVIWWIIMLLVNFVQWLWNLIF